MRQQVTRCRLEALLHYDEITGVFTWRVRRGGRAKIGEVAGSLVTGGYVGIRVDDVLYPAHRLAWLYVHARWPSDQLDHINGDRADNRIGNLRECTPAENMQNYGRHANKKSGLPPGVSPLRGKYQAHISHSGKLHYLGLFLTPELASSAYLAAKAELHLFNPVPRKGLR